MKCTKVVLISKKRRTIVLLTMLLFTQQACSVLTQIDNPLWSTLKNYRIEMVTFQ